MRRLRRKRRHARSHRGAEHDALRAHVGGAGDECGRLVLHAEELNRLGLRVVAKPAGSRDGHLTGRQTDTLVERHTASSVENTPDMAFSRLGGA
mgnify:CR=1 FL=1